MKYLKGLLWITGILFCMNANAGVVVGGTRIIYSATEKESSIKVTNPEKDNPYLIQTWVECFDKKSTCKVPFLVTPPLFRLDAGRENILRIIKLDDNLPVNRESVFWLNVKSITSSMKDGKSLLQLAVRSKIKLFFRPSGLNARDANEAYKKLTFKSSDNTLTAINPTPYYVSFYEVKADGRKIPAPGMVAPRGTVSWKVKKSKSVIWSAINDYGGITKESKQAM